MNKKMVASLFALLASSISMAQIEVESNNIFTKAKTMIDSKSVVHGVDTNYVKTPHQPWQISVKSRVAQTDLQMHSVIDGASVFNGEFLDPQVKGYGDLSIAPRFMTKISTSVGVKVGYKGLSASYSFPVAGDKGKNLSLKSVSNWYSVNLRWHSFKTDNPETRFTGDFVVREDPSTEDWKGPVSLDMKDHTKLDAPIKIQTLMFDAFYIFNKKKFSYAAAYNQKTYQVRSAGSLIAGIMCYYADFKYNTDRSADFIVAMGGIGRLRQYQGNVGVGYSYNFVPFKGFLINGTFMPTISVLNRTKVNHYTSNALAVDQAHVNDPEGTDYADEYKIESAGSHSDNNRLALNFNARLSFTYSWDRYFINAHGQFNNFNYKHDSMHGHLNDWYINASVGVRL